MAKQVSYRKNFQPFGIFIYITFIVISFITMYPIFYIIINSFKTRKELAFNAIGFPKNLNFANYITAYFTSDILNNFKTTLILCRFRFKPAG